MFYVASPGRRTICLVDRCRRVVYLFLGELQRFCRVPDDNYELRSFLEHFLMTVDAPAHAPGRQNLHATNTNRGGVLSRISHTYYVKSGRTN